MAWGLQGMKDPVVERPVILELEGAQRVGDPFDGIGQAVGVVVHRVDAPGVAGPVVRHLENPVDDRIAQVEVGGGHVDFGPQDMAALCEFAVFHPLEEIEVVLDAAVAPGALPPGFGQGAAVFPDGIGRELADIGLAEPDQLQRKIVEGGKIVGGIEQFVVPVETEPFDIAHDRFDVGDLFLARVGIVEAHVADAVVFQGNAEIEADRLGMTDVEKAVRLRGKPGHRGPVLAGPEIVGNDLPDEIDGSAGCFL